MTSPSSPEVSGLIERLKVRNHPERFIAQGPAYLMKLFEEAASALSAYEARLEEARKALDELGVRNAEVSMLAHKWMVAHDMRAAGMPYAYPEPADVPKSEARAQSAEARLETARKALEPFAKFRLEGFDGEVLEVVPSSPDSPARRIEPIWTSHFRNAKAALTALEQSGEGLGSSRTNSASTAQEPKSDSQRILGKEDQ